MNIMYLCDEYPPGRHGGIGTVVQLLAREMVKLGHTVVVAGFYDWGYGGEDRFNDQGVEVFRFRRKGDAPLFRRRDRKSVRALYRVLRSAGIFQYWIDKSLPAYHQQLLGLIQTYQIELVEQTDFQDYLQYCIRETLLPDLPVPTIVKLHGCMSYFLKEAGMSVPPYVYKSERKLLSRADEIVSVSKYTARRTTEILDLAKEMTICYNGIDLPRVASVEKIEGAVVFTGTLVKKKGIYQLMKAWSMVVAELPYARLSVYGKGPVEYLQQLLSPEAKPTVVFAGHVTRAILFERLAAAQVAVFPSYSEAFALSPAEAMACGTAVVYTLRSSGPELIQNGIDGILIDPDNVNDLAGAIISMIKNDDMRKRMEVSGRQRVEELFTISNIALQHQALYQKIISR